MVLQDLIEVVLPGRSYPVVIGAGARERFVELLSERNSGRAFWIADHRVAKRWSADLAGRGFFKPEELIVLPSGESQKRLATVEKLCRLLSQRRAERGDVLIAWGGGVIGDLVGFTAACYLRGIAFVQMPTTLLAMVDSSVGGKTGVDLPEGKNLVGAFHQPLLVIADVDFLKTLPLRELRCGFAEVVKTALIGDATLFGELQGDLTLRCFRRDPEALTRIISASVRVKADVVRRDEREGDLRRILNFGHTIGHALEALGGYKALKHGEAVFWGLAAAVELSVRMGLLPEMRADQIRTLLQPQLQAIPKLDFAPKAILQAIARDKKVRGGAPHFVLLKEIAKPVIADQVSQEALSETLQGLRLKMR